MYKLINHRIYGIVLILLLIWTFYLYHGLCRAMHVDLWFEGALFFAMAYYTSVLRFKHDLEEDPYLKKYLIPICKPSEWLFDKCHCMWNQIGFLKNDAIKIGKGQYENAYAILSIIGNFMIISFIQVAHWNTPTDIVLNLLIIVLLFLLGGFISFADLELSLRIAIKIATRIKKG